MKRCVRDINADRGAAPAVAPAADLSLAMPMTRDCVTDIREIITRARQSVVRHVNSTMVLAYWLVGRRLVVEEQKGASRAAYGEHLIERVSREISATFGSGFGIANLRNFRQFYLMNPGERQIRYALRSELSWTHFRALIRVGDPKERAYYLEEASAQDWDTRELERQIRSRSYWRVREHQLPEPVVYESHDVTPEQILKDPCVAEFLKLREPLRGKEKKVEKRIIANIEEFMLELGRGFSLIKRQYRVPLDGVNKYIDLVFYNYILRCFVLIDLKTSKLTSRDIGQMDAYRRMFDALKRQETDNSTIGILLGTEIDCPEVRFSILSECQPAALRDEADALHADEGGASVRDRARPLAHQSSQASERQTSPRAERGPPVTQTTFYKNWSRQNGRGRSRHSACGLGYPLAQVLGAGACASLRDRLRRPPLRASLFGASRKLGVYDLVRQLVDAKSVRVAPGASLRLGGVPAADFPSTSTPHFD